MTDDTARAEAHTLIGAYVLDAVSAAERRLFEDHIAVCSSCAQETAQLLATATQLAGGTEAEPPAHLREQVLAAALRTPQLPPDPDDRSDGPAEPFPPGSGDRPDQPVGPVAPGSGDRPAGAIGRGSGDRSGRPAGPVEPGSGDRPGEPFRRGSGDRPDLPAEPHRRRAGGRRGTWLRRTAALAGAAAVAVAVTLGVQGVRTNDRLERDLQALEQVNSRNSQVAELLAAPDAKLVRGEVAGGGTGTVVASSARGQVLFLAHGLARLPDDRTYQMWLIGADGPRPAGLLTSADAPEPLLASGFTGREAVGLTVEPRGGSPRPTTPTVVVLPLV
ncbi:anti-sigma factor domain-containing protein [Actinosynnema sp. NPDC059335]|uniref:anti-sigma factor n=1 Tax=Actinosynnema sp. NPDC059335 TaxID=3346804 RepID=UPI00366CE982